MSERVFELRTYTAEPGRLADVQKRFREHTVGFFAKHGLEVVAFFTPLDGPTADNTLVYLLAFDSRAAAETAWASFQADPEWLSVRAASMENGPIVASIESVFLSPTDYSPLH
ncbi:MAG: family containing protein [Frondihabitans sp.]|nr:family containing protein [Frondihabitans sp.]